MKLQLSCFVLSFALYSCSHQTQQPTPKLQHAQLTEPQSELIAQGISRLMHSKPIILDKDAFLNNSVLVIGNMRGHESQDKGFNNTPDSFELLIKDKQCFIRHLDSKATELLPQVKCKETD